GKSPRNTSCSETSPVSLFTSSTRAQSGLLNVRSRVRHSSSEYLGSRNSLPRKRRSRFLPVKSWIGEISLNSSPRPSSQNHLNESIWVWMRFGSGRAPADSGELRRVRQKQGGERQDLGQRRVITTLTLDRGRGRAVEGQGHTGPSSVLMARARAERQRIDGWQGRHRTTTRTAGQPGTVEFRPAGRPCQGVKLVGNPQMLAERAPNRPRRCG